MEQVHQACRDRWLALDNTIRALVVKAAIGEPTKSDEAYMLQLIDELRSYKDSGQMPVDVLEQWDRKF